MATNNAIDSNIPIEIAKGGTNATSMSNTYGVAYYDGSKIATTAVGSAGQVLTSNGAGVAPSFQASAGSGSLVLIQTQSGSASAFNFTSLSSSYTSYVV